MATRPNSLQFKRSATAGYIPSSLAAGEPTYNTVDNKLFMGNGSTVVRVDAGSFSGECSTAAGTAKKTVACAGLALLKGVEVTIKFKVTNNVAPASLTLNVGGTGDKLIKYRGENLPSAAVLSANRVYKFYYNGTNWELIGDLDTDTTVGAALTTHTGNSTIHITSAERTNWNAAYGWGNHAGLYPLYSGTGATGTWGISITGNSATTSQTNFASLSVNSKAVYHSANLLNIGTTASSARTALGLGTMALETASNYSLTSHNHSGVYEPVFTKKTAFNKSFGTSAGTVAVGNDSRIINGQTAFAWGDHASAGYALNSALTDHINKVNNPHAVTKSQVGLGNVLNVASYSKTESDGRYLPFSGGTLTGDLSIRTGNTDKYITFDYSGNNTYNWRIGYLGTGTGDANYFTIQSSKSTGGVYFDALRLGLETLNAQFFGTVTAPTFSGSLSGNASTATTLATTRAINGTNFNGSAAITTANWGTARSIGVVNSDGTGTAVITIVNGSADVNLKLPATIKASLTGNASSATKLGTETVGSTQLPFYLDAGTATAITQADLRIGLFGTTAIGSTQLPIYLAANGVPTAITQANLRKGLFGTTAIGSSTKPVYIAANGVPTASTSFGGVTGIGTANPLMDGTVAVGTSTLAARQDHRHPVDTSRAAAGQTMHIGTTAVAINRASATLNLTGIGTLAMTGALIGNAKFTYEEVGGVGFLKLAHSDTVTPMHLVTTGGQTMYSEGVPASGDDGGSGTLVYLNGSLVASETASIYAPTTAGSNHQILTSNGFGEPYWDNITNLIPWGGSGDLTTVSRSDHTHSAYAAASHAHSISQIYNFPTSMPASDVYAWAKEAAKPAYSYSEISATPTALKNPYSITLQAAGTSLGSYNGSSAKTFNITYTNIGAAAASHSHSNYLTANQTITLSGDVTGSGKTTIQTVIEAGKVTNAMLAGSIANAKLANSSITINGVAIFLGESVDTPNTTYADATISIRGLMSAADKRKLNDIADGANNYSLPISTYNVLGGIKPWKSHTAPSTGPTAAYDATAVIVNAFSTTASRYYAIEADSLGHLFVNVPWSTYVHPTSTGFKHIPAGGSSGKILRWSSDGTAVWGDDTDTIYHHPVHTSYVSGLYKIIINGYGHVSYAAAVEKDDITALGIPSQDTTYTLASLGAAAAGHTHSYLPLSGGTVTGSLSVNTLAITNDSAVSHLAFGRGSYNYITMPASGLLGILPNGQGIQATNGMWFSSSGLSPGTNNTFSVGTNGMRFAAVHATTIYEAGTQLSIKYAASSHTHSGYALTSHDHSGVYATASHTHSYVPTTRKINNRALTSNITLSPQDVGAATASHNHYSIGDADNELLLTGTAVIIHTDVSPKSGFWKSNINGELYVDTNTYSLSSHTHSGYALTSHNHTGVYAASSHTHSVATTSANGLMSSADKQALNGHNESAKRYFCDSSATQNDKDIMEVGGSGAQISLVPGRRIAIYFRWGGNMGTGTLRFCINNVLFLPVYYNGEPAKQGLLKDKRLYEFMYNPANSDSVGVNCWILLGDHEPPVTYSVGNGMVADAGAAAALVPVHNRRMDLVMYYYDGDYKYARYTGPDLTNSSWTYNNNWYYTYM